MNFESAVAYLQGFVSYERLPKVNYSEENFNLERFRAFSAEYVPEYGGLKFVHVAGSKGKGSTCAFIANYLWKAGFRVGLYTSPHIVDVTERFWLNGVDIGRERFAECVENLKVFVESCGDADFLKLTHFELLTALAFKFFVDSGVEYVVLEVGLGGRLDATNVVTPELSILTTVELEHTEILGDTLSKILDEKLGIVKSGVPVLVGWQSEEGMALVTEKLRKIGRVEGADLFFVKNVSEADEARIKNLKVAFEALKLMFGSVDEKIFSWVLENVKLIGRFDVRLVDRGTVVFDMAHTENSVRNLVNSLKKNFSGRKFVFLVSVMRGKQVEAILKLISGLAERIIFCCANEERGYSGRELADFYEKLNLPGKVSIEEDCLVAYKKAPVLDGTSDEILIVTGSSFLVGKILQKN